MGGKMSGLGPGDRAPDFTLTASSGDKITLSDFQGKKNVVLFFYPKDGSPVCTREACAFRDAYEVFEEAGAEVIGISTDSAAAHEKFSQRHGLPFLLLSDPGGKVRKQFKVPSTLGFLPGRATYVIDKQGVIRLLFSSQLKAMQHVEEALAVLRNLDEKTGA
jgi:peroxiredoxin Q/BCP